MIVYRVQYYLITGRTTESIRGQEFSRRHGVEKLAYVVAATPEEASAHVAAKNDCEILGVSTQLQNVEVATAADFEAAAEPPPAPVIPATPALAWPQPTLTDADRQPAGTSASDRKGRSE